jgi:glycosyltransferase involved in cell wall biosynthesis
MHLVASVGHASFGLGPIALNLAKSQHEGGAHTDVWCLDSDAEIAWAARSAELDPSALHRFETLGPGFVGFSPAMESAVTSDPGQAYDIIHQHSLWLGVSRVTNRWRHVLNRPTVIAPQGTLDEWALRRSRWKKQLALWAYERRNLEGAACLQALSVAEAESFRAFGLANPIAVIPNGISDAWLASRGDGQAFRQTFNIPDHLRIMLFLSRITPKKGLPMLFEAMHGLGSCLSDWVLIVAGVDEFNHLAELKPMVNQLGLSDRVRFVGPLFDQAKRDAFAAAELFVLPSHSEGAPVVVLEALGAAVPVITTQASPWAALTDHRCGWWTTISRDGLVEALEDALPRSPSALRDMGERGQLLVETSFTWRKIGSDLLAVYEWLLGRAAMPPSVIVS